MNQTMEQRAGRVGTTQSCSSATGSHVLACGEGDRVVVGDALGEFDDVDMSADHVDKEASLCLEECSGPKRSAALDRDLTTRAERKIRERASKKSLVNNNGYCYLAMVRILARRHVADALGSEPTLAAIMTMDARDFYHKLNHLVVEKISDGYYHVVEGTVGYTVKQMVLDVMAKHPWINAGLALRERSKRNVSCRANALPLDTVIGGMFSTVPTSVMGAHAGVGDEDEVVVPCESTSLLDTSCLSSSAVMDFSSEKGWEFKVVERKQSVWQCEVVLYGKLRFLLARLGDEVLLLPFTSESELSIVRLTSLDICGSCNIERGTCGCSFVFSKGFRAVRWHCKKLTDIRLVPCLTAHQRHRPSLVRDGFRLVRVAMSPFPADIVYDRPASLVGLVGYGNYSLEELGGTSDVVGVDGAVFRTGLPRPYWDAAVGGIKAKYALLSGLNDRVSSMLKS